VRYLTFSCYRQLPLLKNPKIADAFVARLAAERERLGFGLIAWVVMPEHVHLLVWPNVSVATMPRVLHGLKRPFAEGVITRWRGLNAKILERVTTPGGRVRFWQDGGGYDRNVFSDEELAEKIAYIHNNPVERGLVARPEDWTWSSARWYAGMWAGEVPIDPVRKPGT